VMTTAYTVFISGGVPVISIVYSVYVTENLIDLPRSSKSNARNLVNAALLLAARKSGWTGQPSPVFEPIELAYNVQRVALGEILGPSAKSHNRLAINNLRNIGELEP
jgi:hypothetical protein